MNITKILKIAGIAGGVASLAAVFGLAKNAKPNTDESDCEPALVFDEAEEPVDEDKEDDLED